MDEEMVTVSGTYGSVEEREVIVLLTFESTSGPMLPPDEEKYFGDLVDNVPHCRRLLTNHGIIAAVPAP